MKKITRRQFLLAAGVTGTAAALAGCGAASSASTSAPTDDTSSTAAPAGGKTFRHSWGADMQTMDTHRTTSNYAIPLSIFDRLFEIQLNEDGTTELIKSMVKEYTISDDGLVYDFTLHSGIKFSDGSDFTASDVAYTFTRMLTLPDSVQTDYAIAILGAQELLDGTADTLTGVEVIDDTRVKVTLAVPFAGFLYQLATPSCCMFGEAIVEAAGERFGLDPAVTIGTGPYMVTEWVSESKITLALNPHYWGEKPSAENVIISIIPDASTRSMMFQNGELDIIDCDNLDTAVVESTYRTAYADRITQVNRLSTSYFAMNATMEPTNDVNVRKAMQMAVDRQTILDAVYNGNGTVEDGIFPHGLIGFSEENQGWLKYDPAAAKELLAKSGYPDGVTIEMSTDSSNGDASMLVLQAMQQNFEEAGIHANIVSYDEASWLDLRSSGNMCTYTSTWTADYNDPDNFIFTFFGNESKTKVRSLNYQDTDVMQRVNDVRGIVDDAERLAEYAALERKIVQEDAAWIPLYSRTHLFVLGENVEHFVPHWAGYSDFPFRGITLKG